MSSSCCKVLNSICISLVRYKIPIELRSLMIKQKMWLQYITLALVTMTFATTTNPQKDAPWCKNLKTIHCAQHSSMPKSCPSICKPIKKMEFLDGDGNIQTINNRVDFPAPAPSPRPVTPPAVPVTLPPSAPVTLPPRLTTKPACAANLEFDAPCEHDEEYNSTIRARIDDLINIHGGVNVFLKDPELKNLLTEVVVPREDAPSQRSGAIETAICAAEEKVIIPERAKTENGEWAFVLNQGSAKQAIKYEKCISEGRKCSLGAAGTEINTVCRQKYIYRTMLVMDGQGNKISPDQVLMPSCCICYRL